MLRLTLKQPRCELALLLAIYVAAYFAYYFYIGPGFRDNGLLDYTHFLAPQWLQADFFGSLWYLHAQPPLMNALIGIIFHLWPQDYRTVFQLLYFAAGAASVTLIWLALCRLHVRRVVRLLLCANLCVSPAFYLFGVWYYCTHLELMLCSAAVFFLAGFYRQDYHRHRNLAGLFFICALLGLTRGQWHLALFALMALGMASMERGRMRRQVMILSLICLVPIGGWYAKNWAVFGFFGPSSWMGANMSQLGRQILWDEQLAELGKQGKIAPDFPGDFIKERIIRRYPPGTLPLETKHAVLQPYKTVYLNLNYAGMIPSARQDMRDTLTVLKMHVPEYALMALFKMLKVSASPTVLHPSINPYKNFVFDKDFLPSSLRFPLGVGAFLFYFAIPLALAVYGRRYLDRGQWKFARLCLCMIFVLLLLACALNGGEQDRMRWGWLPLHLCVAGLFFEMLCVRLGTYRKRQNQH